MGLVGDGADSAALAFDNDGINNPGGGAGPTEVPGLPPAAPTAAAGADVVAVAASELFPRV